MGSRAVVWERLARRFLPRTVLAHFEDTRAAIRPRKWRKDVVVMFADIEGCTRLCEDLPPQEMNRVIETYFSRCLDIVREAGGEIAEVLGDGFLALFEGPSLREDAARAVAAALRIRESTRELNASARSRHDPIVVNVGLNAGSASVGITRLRGRSGERWVYAATGPVTNVAARLSALASRGQILLAGKMAELVEGYEFRALGTRTLKNVSGQVEVYEIATAERERELGSGRVGGRQADG
jgi:class 3 adenylate cyclase